MMAINGKIQREGCGAPGRNCCHRRLRPRHALVGLSETHCFTIAGTISGKSGLAAAWIGGAW
jgi:hypothetical protein